MKKESFFVFFGLFISLIYQFSMHMRENIKMGTKEIVIQGIITVVTVLITAWTTLRISNKSQIEKNTATIEKLVKRIGLSEEITLTYMVNEINKNIGCDNRDNLTRQHETMQNNIIESYSSIKKRYEKEDEAYRSFSLRQIDIKETLDSFSKDYMMIQKDNRNLRDENNKLLYENKQLLKELHKIVEVSIRDEKDR